MTRNEKREAIKAHVKNMFEDVVNSLEPKMDKAFNSGAIDTEDWDPNYNMMLLPKAMLIAFLEDEADQYRAQGTSHAKYVKEEAKNIKLHM